MSTWRPASPGPGGQDPRRVGESLDRVTRGMGGPAASVISVVFAHWEGVVGAAVADHATPVTLKDGVLVVAVEDAAWATQLRFLERQILERLEEASGSAVATRVDVRVRPRGGGRPGGRGKPREG